MYLDMAAVIKAARLGRTRKEAQVDTCAVFAAALFDVLKDRGVPCRMFTAAPRYGDWYHSVVKIGSAYFDSMGEFSEAIYRARAKIHPRVTLGITFKRDVRADCYEADSDVLHGFYVKMLGKAIDALYPNARIDGLPGQDGMLRDGEPEAALPGGPRF